MPGPKPTSQTSPESRGGEAEPIGAILDRWQRRADLVAPGAPTETGCPYGLCDGTGMRYVTPEEDPEGGVTQCRCLIERSAQERRRRLFETAHVPPIFRGLRLSKLDQRNPTSLRETKAFVRAWPDHGGRGLLILGPVGTGKSTLAYAAFNELVDRGVPGIAHNGSRLLSDLGQGIGRHDLQAQMQMLARIDLLLIDDLAAHRTATMFATESFYALVNDRYEGMRPTIFTSMIHPNDWAGNSLDPQIRQMWTAIASRIIAGCNTLGLEGADRRLEPLGPRRR